MRIIVEGFGRRIADLELFVPLRKPSPASAPDVPGHDPRSTIAVQVEQASEPAPCFGFGVETIMACGEVPASREG